MRQSVARKDHCSNTATFKPKPISKIEDRIFAEYGEGSLLFSYVRNLKCTRQLSSLVRSIFYYENGNFQKKILPLSPLVSKGFSAAGPVVRINLSKINSSEDISMIWINLEATTNPIYIAAGESAVLSDSSLAESLFLDGTKNTVLQMKTTIFTLDRKLCDSSLEGNLLSCITRCRVRKATGNGGCIPSFKD